MQGPIVGPRRDKRKASNILMSLFLYLCDYYFN